MNCFSPLLFCFIGPGASGKSSICTAVTEKRNDIQLSISTTTREPRPYEREGKEYYFIRKEEFKSRLDSGCFLEHALFAGNNYGTEKINIDNAVLARKHLALDIEIQGVVQLKEQFKERVVVIFVCPPSLLELRERFQRRGTDSPERIQQRMDLAAQEIKIALSNDFSDFVIINDNLDKSIEIAESIILSESARRRNISEEQIQKLVKV